VRLPRALDTSLRTAVALVVLPLALILYSALAIAMALLGASAARVHWCYVGFSRVCVRIGVTSLQVHGAHLAVPGRGYVVVSNHESAGDPPCIVAALPRVLIRFVVKRALMRIPIFGSALRHTGNVTVVRTQTSGDVQRIREGMAHRAPEVSMLFFAEGTRSRNHEMHAFKMGAFATAIAQHLPVLPVAVAGTFEIWPKGTLRLHHAPVAVEVGEPIPTEGLTLDDRESLREASHEAVAKLRERARERLWSDGSE
jgi:1-acyl-sn-glycerol-3-phosphate acyltransferase